MRSSTVATPRRIGRSCATSLGLGHVDAGEGWLIFALPPAELGVHPTDGEPSSELYLMCDDVEATVAELEARGVEFDGEIKDAGFGRLASIKLPSGAALPIYEPRHPLAITR